MWQAADGKEAFKKSCKHVGEGVARVPSLGHVAIGDWLCVAHLLMWQMLIGGDASEDVVGQVASRHVADDRWEISAQEVVRTCGRWCNTHLECVSRGKSDGY
ncbi:hypothetical protein Scep_007468 [Stephania cephalantha]|uniref:Uncharacterized protein n=1 Tax=Stephania cephalantha TaxID=152367 RepID=A0AAP0KA19_9MAGN